jgi:hypothetical protein
MAEDTDRKADPAGAGEVLDTSKLLDDVAERCDVLAKHLIDHDEDDEPGMLTELHSLAMYRVACALESLQAEATETLMDEVAQQMGGTDGG